MTTWIENQHAKANIVIGQIAGFQRLAQEQPEVFAASGATLESLTDPFYKLLENIYMKDLPLARLLDESHLIMHAEGPAVGEGMPWLSAVNWITTTTDKRIRSLCAEVIDLSATEGHNLKKKLDLRLTGFAPGSLYVGIKLMPPPADMLPEDTQMIGVLQSEIENLPTMVRFIGDEGMRPGLEESSPDPALRDVEMLTLMQMSPTGKLGIHTLELSSPKSSSVSLSLRERVVLRAALKKPDLRRTQQSSFIGEVREADLDARRLHLRGITDIGTLRCVLPELTAEQARKLLANRVRATGHYQTDRSGKPRILYVEKIEPIAQTGELFPTP